ncbi:RNA polymerase subunit sigma-70 [Gibbsiella quercinecans]|uniref:RNA polymerase sigma factor n=1 Tax=Gibbsiella quercinecans TaxID=929813 RepID=UPI000EF1FB81|nr:RNA polymerase sigma factor [Gibbsiella quercinecans]RLM15247.1 RNA polymerase subunit sigma-70 [Gibbsiella quercinecans]
MSETDLKHLFSHYSQALQRYLTRKVRDPHLAADLLQECFLRLAQRLEQNEDISDKKAYLFKTANNLVLDHQRYQARWQMQPPANDGEAALDALPDRRPQMEQMAINQQQLALLAQVLAQLPERTQQIFLLHRLEHLTQQQVARQLNISVSTVEKHLASALAAMLRVI